MAEVKPRVAFKKKKRKKKNSNIREATVLETVEGEETEEVSLQDARFLQRYRKRRGGMNAEKLNDNDNTQDLIQTEKMLGQEFVKNENQQDQLKKKMETWIEEQLEIQRTGKVSEKKKVEKKLTVEEALYQTPEYLKVTSKQGMEVDGAGWLTGISEVPLDISVKMDNIARTEAAKAALFSGKRPREEDKQCANNYSSNFAAQARAFRDKQQKRDDKRKKTEVGPSAPTHRRDKPVDNVPFATDDAVAMRFIKRYNWR